MKTNNKKKVVIGKPPKAFVGMAMAGLGMATNIMGAIGAKKEARKAAIEAERSALTQQQGQDQLELDAYPEEGNMNVNYYQASGGKIGGPGDKLTKKEVKEVNIATGANFDSNTANRLFTRTGVEGGSTPAPSVDFGRYKKVGYFEMGNTDGDTVRIKNTSANPHNPSTIRSVMDEIRKLNPGKKIELDFAYKASGGTVKGGGSHDTIGGKLEPISSDMELAKGNTHESSKIDNTSGIKLIQGNKAIAEVENDETIKDGNLVYSDRLKASNGKTFADNAKAIARKKASAEKRLGMGDGLSKKTTERRVGMFDAAENALFMEQEEYKKDKGIENNERVPKAGWGMAVSGLKSAMDAGAFDKPSGGGGVGKALSRAIPFIDNVANSIITNRMTPKVPTPSYLKARKLNTQVNVNPEINAVADAENSAARAIEQNTSNSNVARNNIANVRLRGAEQKGRIFAHKENQESQLENRNIMFQQQNEAMNAQKRDAYSMANAARLGQMKSETSANFSNMAGDFTDMENNKRDEAYNTEALAAFKTAYDKNGIVGRSDDSMMKWMELMMKKKNGGKLANGGEIDPSKKKFKK